MQIIDIGSRRELMLPDGVLEEVRCAAALRLHHPVPQEVALVMDRPWERGSSHHGYMTVFQDDRHGPGYRMYYAVRATRYANGERIRGREYICYAESADGRQWVRPDLGLFEFEGSTANNIVWMEDGDTRRGIHGFSPFIDTHPACSPEQRYKAIAALGANGGPYPAQRKGLVALVSPDGLQWSMLTPEAVITDGAFDSQNLAFWDAVRGEYRAYWRDFYTDAAGQRYAPAGAHSDGKRFRAIKTATSADFRTWSDAEWLYFPGSVPEELYTNQVQPYCRAPQVFLGFPARYVERPWSPAIQALPETERRRELIDHSANPRLGTAVSDTVFMSSRDGVTFHRWGEAFVRPGLRQADNWFYGDNYVNWGLVTTASAISGAPDELSLYVSEASRGDVSGQPAKTFRRQTLRQDGFVSVQATRGGGQAVTRLLRFDGNRLMLNFSASAAGSLRVELQDRHGAPLPGFALDDCVEILGVDLEREVRWASGADLANLIGQPITMRFELTDADLYAFRFQKG